MVRKLSGLKVLIKGGGEVGSAIAHRLHRSHFRICITELADPLAVSRGTTYSEAVYDGMKTIEGVTAELTELVSGPADTVYSLWQEEKIPVLIDSCTVTKDMIEPDILIDAVMAKKNLGTNITDAPLVIGMGPGFIAGRDVHIVVETNHGNNLGRVIFDGEAESNTGEPVEIGRLTKERVIWAPCDGSFTANKKIGDHVTCEEVIGTIGNLSMKAPYSGMLRGIIRDNVRVLKGTKIIEIDPINDSAVCYVIRDKMRAIAGGVLEAIMAKFNI
jgi:xanthine dehydrogenase accessory factor